LVDTVRDTHAGLRSPPDAAVTGLTRAEELDLVDRLSGESVGPPIS
jgi:hypothetical protein